MLDVTVKSGKLLHTGLWRIAKKKIESAWVKLVVHTVKMGTLRYINIAAHHPIAKGGKAGT